jgi:hypothetical protein
VHCEVQDVPQLEIRRSALRWNRANEDWRDDLRARIRPLGGVGPASRWRKGFEGVSVLDSRRPTDLPEESAKAFLVQLYREL